MGGRNASPRYSSRGRLEGVGRGAVTGLGRAEACPERSAHSRIGLSRHRAPHRPVRRPYRRASCPKAALSASPLHLVLSPCSRVGACDLHEASEDLGSLVFVAQLMRDRCRSQPQPESVCQSRARVVGWSSIHRSDLGAVDLRSGTGSPTRGRRSGTPVRRPRRRSRAAPRLAENACVCADTVERKEMVREAIAQFARVFGRHLGLRLPRQEAFLSSHVLMYKTSSVAVKP